LGGGSCKPFGASLSAYGLTGYGAASLSCYRPRALHPSPNFVRQR